MARCPWGRHGPFGYGTTPRRRRGRSGGGHGTLVIMAGTMQRFWKHEVPKTNEDVGERINLTFRYIGEALDLSDLLASGLSVLGVAVPTATADDKPPFRLTI